MIGCQCGGFTTTQRAKAGAAELRWQQCSSCGRCGAYLLAVSGKTMSTGQTARRIWNDPAALSRITSRLAPGKHPGDSPPTETTT